MPKTLTVQRVIAALTAEPSKTSVGAVNHWRLFLVGIGWVESLRELAADPRPN